MPKNLDKISFIISTFNGWELLQKNLPSIYLQTREGDEVFIADDASKDLTITHLKHCFDLELVEENNDFKLWQRKIKAPGALHKIYLTVLENKKNLRFGANNNLAVSLAKYEMVCLLNNDLRLGHDWRVQIRRAWKKAEKEATDDKLMAITFLERSAKNKDLKRGKNKLIFKRGRFIHSADENLTFGQTAWACGGSSIFDRKKFLELGGFDVKFYPAYWEDIDLSYQAKKHGWQVYFAPNVEVIHDHETTHNKVFGVDKIAEMSWKNGTNFLSKNGTTKQKIQSLLWSPYWWIKRKPFFWLLILILLLAIILRFYHLGQIPAGLTWDETAIAYNGWGIWETRRDEWLNRLPVSFRSFGDYKAPLAIYLNGFFTQIGDIFGFDLTWVIRLPFALSGVLGVWGMILLVRELFSPFKTKKEAEKLGLLAGLILAFNPSHLFFSRIGLEAGMALTLVIWGVYAWYYYWQRVERNRIKVWQSVWVLWVSILLFSLSLYTYHSTKIMVPILGLILLFQAMNKLKFRLPQLLISVLLAILVLYPLAYDSFYGAGLTRAGLSFINNEELSVWQKMIMMANNFGSHLRGNFLVGGDTGVGGLAHGNGKLGILLPPTFLMLIWGLIVGVRQIMQKRPIKNIFWLGCWWTLWGIFPAVIGDTVPHVIRSFGALGGLVLISMVGIEGLITWKKNENWEYWTYRSLIILFFIWGMANWIFYLKQFTTLSTNNFNNQILEAGKLTSKYAPQVEKIKMTNEYGQTYIYLLLAKKIDPIEYQHGALNKYHLVDEIKPSDLESDEPILVVAGQKNLLEVENKAKDMDLKPVEILYDVDGEIKLIFYLINNKNIDAY